MRAILKRVHSPDIEDLQAYQPDDPSNFAFLLQAIIGPDGMDGEESFDIEVCTPKWIEETYNLTDILIGRHHLIVQEYNYEALIIFINNYLNSFSSENWGDLAQQIGRLGKWEFEDYK